MNRAISVILLLLMLFTITGCGMGINRHRLTMTTTVLDKNTPVNTKETVTDSDSSVQTNMEERTLRLIEGPLIPAELLPYVTKEFTTAFIYTQGNAIYLREDMPSVIAIRDIAKKYITAYANKDYKTITGKEEFPYCTKGLQDEMIKNTEVEYNVNSVKNSEFSSSLIGYDMPRLEFQNADYCRAGITVYFTLNHIKTGLKLKQGNKYSEYIQLSFLNQGNWLVNGVEYGRGYTDESGKADGPTVIPQNN